MEEKSWVNVASPHILKEHDITSKGGKIGSWEEKKNLPLFMYATQVCMHYINIYGISIVLKSNRGAIREKYLEWLLRRMVMEKGRETSPRFLWFIWANSGFWWSDGLMRLKWSLPAFVVQRPQNVLNSLTRPSACRGVEWKFSSSLFTPIKMFP